MSVRRNNSTKKGLGRGLGSLLGSPPIFNTENASQKNLNTQKMNLSEHSFAEEQNSSGLDNMDTQNISKERLPTENKPIQNPHLETGGRLPEVITDSHMDSQKIWNIAVDKILPHKKQPRQVFDKQKILELSKSIKEKGILQPIVVRQRSENIFELIAGERRWRAAQAAGLHHVPAIVREVKDQESLELALIENIQRHDLNPIDEALAYQRLQKEYGLTQSQVAEKVGKERATVANSLRLLSLCSDVREMLLSGELSVGHAKVLLSITDSALQKKLAKKITSQKLTVRAAEKWSHQVPRRVKAQQDPLVQTLSEDLQKALGRKVEIEYKKGKGYLRIYFYSNDELNEISEKLKTAWN